MPRLVWNNVAAPDFSTSNQLRRDAAEAMGRASTQLSNAIKDYQTAQQNNAARLVAQRAAQIQDPEQYRQALESGSLFEGIDPSYLSAQTINAASSLLANREQQAEARENRAWNQKERSRTEEGWEAGDRARAKLAVVRGLMNQGKFDEAAALQLETALTDTRYDVTEPYYSDIRKAQLNEEELRLKAQAYRTQAAKDQHILDEYAADDLYRYFVELIKSDDAARDPDYVAQVYNQKFDELGKAQGYADNVINLAKAKIRDHFASQKDIVGDFTTPPSADQTGSPTAGSVVGMLRDAQINQQKEVNKQFGATDYNSYVAGHKQEEANITSQITELQKLQQDARVAAGNQARAEGAYVGGDEEATVNRASEILASNEDYVARQAQIKQLTDQRTALQNEREAYEQASAGARANQARIEKIDQMPTADLLHFVDSAKKGALNSAEAQQYQLGYSARQKEADIGLVSSPAAAAVKLAERAGLDPKEDKELLGDITEYIRDILNYAGRKGVSLTIAQAAGIAEASLTGNKTWYSLNDAGNRRISMDNAEKLVDNWNQFDQLESRHRQALEDIRVVDGFYESTKKAHERQLAWNANKQKIGKNASAEKQRAIAETDKAREREVASASAQLKDALAGTITFQSLFSASGMRPKNSAEAEKLYKNIKRNRVDSSQGGD